MTPRIVMTKPSPMVDAADGDRRLKVQKKRYQTSLAPNREAEVEVEEDPVNPTVAEARTKALTVHVVAVVDGAGEAEMILVIETGIETKNPFPVQAETVVAGAVEAGVVVRSPMIQEVGDQVVAVQKSNPKSHWIGMIHSVPESKSMRTRRPPETVITKNRVASVGQEEVRGAETIGMTEANVAIANNPVAADELPLRQAVDLVPELLTMI